MSKFMTVPPDHWDRAREMRRQPTEAERVLWTSMRRGALGAVFRRQHPVGPYIVDFVCLDRKLIVEADGGGHADPDQADYDKVRDEYLAERGFQVKRYFNNEILTNLKGVLEDIREALKK